MYSFIREHCKFSATNSLLTKQRCVTVPDTKEPRYEHKVTVKLWIHGSMQCWVLCWHRLGGSGELSPVEPESGA